jgi:hypothetical protein
MKKVLITTVFVCAAVVCSALPFNFGAKIGANFSKFTVSKSEMEYTFQPGFDLGFFGRVNYNKWYVQPELLYSYQSSKIKAKDVAGELAKFNTHNLNIPVLLGYKLFDVKLTSLRAFIGPEFNYVLSESTDVDLRNPANIAGTIGAGFDIAKLTVDLRYSYAFNQSFKEKEDKTVSFNPHNNVVSLSLGWKFL